MMMPKYIKKKYLEKERVFSFLHGLNKGLDEVRGRILGMKPLPNIKEVFAEVQREESCKRVMLGGTNDKNTNSMVQVPTRAKQRLESSA